MKKGWLLLWSYLSMFLSCEAKRQEDSVIVLPTDKSLLWKVSGNDMKSPSYIFGTMHLICKDDYLWTAAMNKSLESVKEVCFEMDMDDPNIFQEIAMGMIDTNGVQLKNYFSEEDYTLLTRYLADSLHLDINFISSLKPAALISILATDSYQCADMVSYESNILDEAQKLKMNVTGLETAGEQLALLESISTDTIVHEVVAMLRGEKAKNEHEYDDLIKHYKAQDIQQLYTLMKDADPNEMDLNAFLDKRNSRWIERIEEHMEQQPVFFAVGAGHLWGNNGILNLLKNKGYKIEAVK